MFRFYSSAGSQVFCRGFGNDNRIFKAKMNFKILVFNNRLYVKYHTGYKRPIIRTYIMNGHTNKMTDIIRP